MVVVGSFRLRKIGQRISSLLCDHVVAIINGWRSAVGVVALRSLRCFASAVVVALAGGVLAVLDVEGVAVQTPTVENLPVFVINGDHLEQFLLETLSAACHALSAFQPGGGQCRFRNERPCAIEIRSYVVHGESGIEIVTKQDCSQHEAVAGLEVLISGVCEMNAVRNTNGNQYSEPI